MNKLIFLLIATLTTTNAFSAVNRVLDGTVITAGSPSNVLTLPQTTDTLLGRGTTDTLINKSISGVTNTITAIPAATALSGTVPVSNGGTGLATLTSGSILIGAGASSPTFVAPGSAGNVLTSSGGVWASVTPSMTSPSLNASQASPQSVTALSGVVLSALSYQNFVWVTGSAGPVTVTALPSVTAGTAIGQKLSIVATSATNTVTLQDNAGLTGSTLQLNGTWVGGLYSVLSLIWDGTSWVEQGRR